MTSALPSKRARGDGASGRRPGRRPGTASRAGLFRRLIDGLLFPACALLLTLSLLLGGGTRGGFLSDAVLQLLAIPAVFVILAALAQRGGEDVSGWEIALCAAILALPFLQSIPWPAAIWKWFPAQPLRLEALALGGSPAAPLALSLWPDATRLAALSLVPPVALYLGLRHLTFLQQRRCVMLLVSVAVASIFLSLAQMAGGPESPLRFYAVTSPLDAVGLFANRNHFAAFLYVSLMLASAWTVDALLRLGDSQSRRVGGQRPLVIIALGLTAMMLLASTVIITRSRAGVGLTAVGLVCIGVVAVTDERNRWRGASVKLLAVAAVAIVAFAAQAGLGEFTQRLKFDPLTDTRVVVAGGTFAAARDFWPWGSGVGSFQQVFPLYEKPGDLLFYSYVNHAHNEYAELALETGLPGMVVLALALAWIALCGYRLWARPDPSTTPRSRILQRLALLAIALLGLHSFVDYPLRTAAMMAAFAVLAALIAPRRDGDGDERRAKSA